MRIVNPAVRRDIEAGRGLRLNLGAGRKPRPGYYSLDLLELPGVDLVANLNESLDELPDNCVEAIYSHHTLEHVEQLLPLLAELHRVCRPGAQLEIVVPHFSNPRGYSDPTHVRFFGLYTFCYFCDEADQPARKVPSFYVPTRFQIAGIEITLVRDSRLERWLLRPLQWLINRGHGWLDWYERRLCWLLPAASIRYHLTVKKDTSLSQAA